MFVFVGSFENGVAEGEVNGALEEIAAMRLLVHSDSDVWVLLSEVNHIRIIYIQPLFVFCILLKHGKDLS